MTSAAGGQSPRAGVVPCQATNALSEMPGREVLLRDGVALTAAALLLRMALVLAYGHDVPPTDDGAFYHVVAERIARGEGYTWLWPDGVVTFAAHYPVGYAALLGAAYAVLGAHPVVALGVNAVLGAAAVFATHRLATRVTGRAGALCAAAFVALSPTLVGYTLAIMTEGAVAAGLVLGTWFTVRCGERAARGSLPTREVILIGLTLGLTTLVRPQSLLMAPVLGALAAASPLRGATALWRRGAGAVAVTVLCLVVCAPWTIRNCSRMDRCAFVSANGGWNLLIGTFPEGEGAFVPIVEHRVPEACREVFGEAEKDACFGAAGRERIAGDPVGWLSLVPAKWRMTFDFTASASSYLSAAKLPWPEAVERNVSTVEIGARRLLVALALFAAWRAGRSRPAPGGAWERVRHLGRGALLVGGVMSLLGAVSWFAHIAFVWLGATVQGSLRRPVFLAAAAAVAITLLVHAVFFGAGRYSMVLEPLLAGAAAAAWPRARRAADRGPEPAALFDTPIRTG